MHPPGSIRVLAGLLIALVGASAAWAQSDPAAPLCAPGEDCAEMRWGAWGLILLGLIFFAVWFVPPRGRSEEQEGPLSSFPMVQALHRRIVRELTGWRRYQWPVLGAFFILLGVATLAGWR